MYDFSDHVQEASMHMENIEDAIIFFGKDFEKIVLSIQNKAKEEVNEEDVPF